MVQHMKKQTLLDKVKTLPGRQSSLSKLPPDTRKQLNEIAKGIATGEIPASIRSVFKMLQGEGVDITYNTFYALINQWRDSCEKENLS